MRRSLSPRRLKRCLGVGTLCLVAAVGHAQKTKQPAVTAPVEHMPTFTLDVAVGLAEGPDGVRGLARGLRPWKHPLQGKWVQTPLYDGNWVHRTVPDYLIQAGDPQCSTVTDCGGRHGQGDPGFVLENELSTVLRFDRGGRLAMAQKGKGIAGSQFFITERETPWLNGLYAIFGQCNPVQLIQTVARVETQPLDVPKVPVKIRRVLISLGTPGTATAPGKK
jgi:cyclophilin family peptidyl-prolyl cis-trans isomerase